MTQAELIDYFIKNTSDLFDLKEFKHTRIAGGLQFSRSTTFGEEIVTIGINNYNPLYSLHFNISHVNFELNNLMLELDSRLNGVLNVQKNDVCWATSYSSLNGLNRINYLPKIQNFNELDAVIAEIVNYTRDTLLPLSLKFGEPREIHKKINCEKFWETDWRQEFGLGHFFEYKRLFIAHLSGVPDPDFNEIVRIQTELIEAKTNGEYAADWIQALKVQTEILRMLKKN